MNFTPRAQSINATQATAFFVAIESAFDFACAEFRALHERSRSTAFQAPDWLATLHREVAPTFGAEPVTVTVRDDTGRLVLVVPLVRRPQGIGAYLEFADFGLCDYTGSICDPAAAPMLLADADLPRRLAAALPRHDLLTMSKLKGDDPVLEHLFPRMHRARMRTSAYPVAVSGDWNVWRTGTLSGSVRRELDTKRRRMGRKGTPSFVEARDLDEIRRAFDALRAFRAERFKQRGAQDIMSDEAVFGFYRGIAVRGATDGTARTFILYMSGEPVAVMFGIVSRRVFSLLLVGFDLARYRQLSVGLLAIEDTVRASFEHGDLCYDFTIGDYSYKTQIGGQKTPLYEWHRAASLRGHAALARIAIVREAKRMLKPLLRGNKTAPAKEAKDEAA